MLTRDKLVRQAKQFGACGCAIITPPQFPNFSKCIQERKEYRHIRYQPFEKFQEEIEPKSYPSLIVLVFDYFVRNDYPDNSYKISNRGRYLWQTMDVFQKKIIDFLHDNGYEAEKACVPERAAAVIAGLGVIGKNTLFYAYGTGSYVGICVIGTNFIPDQYDEPQSEIVHSDICAKCGRCIRECPAGAIAQEGYRINPFKCVSFLNRHMTETFRSWPDGDRTLGRWIDGCETCQDVCPMNRIPNRKRNLQLIVKPLDFNGMQLEPETFFLTREELMEKRKQITNMNYHNVIDMILDEDEYTPYLPENHEVIVDR